MTITKKEVKRPEELEELYLNYRVYACRNGNSVQAENICNIAESFKPNRPNFYMGTRLAANESPLVPDEYNGKGYTFAIIGYNDNDDYMHELTYEFFEVSEY